MTDAQAKRTRLKVWRDLLTALGGSPSFNDTLNDVLRKIALLAGVSIPCCNQVTNRRLLKLILESYGNTTGFNDAEYPLTWKIAVETGSSVTRPSLPPIQGLFGGGVPPVPPEGWIFGDPDADWAFGDSSTGDVFGKP